MHQLESFFWGIIAALGALFVELIIFIAYPNFINSAATASFSTLFALPGFMLLAALSEEIFKYIIIAKRVDSYSLAKSYIVNSLFVGLGFFLTELTLISYAGNMPSAEIRLELAIVHMGTAALIGYLVALKNPAKLSTFFVATLLTTLLHFSYNFLVLDRQFFQNYLIYFLLAFLVFASIINVARISKKLA